MSFIVFDHKVKTLKGRDVQHTSGDTKTDFSLTMEPFKPVSEIQIKIPYEDKVWFWSPV